MGALLPEPQGPEPVPSVLTCSRQGVCRCLNRRGAGAAACHCEKSAHAGRAVAAAAQLFDEAFRGPFPSVTRWFLTCAHQPEFAAVMGGAGLAKEALKHSPGAKSEAAPHKKEPAAPKQPAPKQPAPKAAESKPAPAKARQTPSPLLAPGGVFPRRLPAPSTREGPHRMEAGLEVHAPMRCRGVIYVRARACRPQPGMPTRVDILDAIAVLGPGTATPDHAAAAGAAQEAAAAPPPSTPEPEDEKPAPKPKDPLAALPPSRMVMDAWKRLYSNTPAAQFKEVCVEGLWNGADVPKSPNNEVRGGRCTHEACDPGSSSRRVPLGSISGSTVMMMKRVSGLLLLGPERD